ncbi:MAG TPA: oxidoreductase [Cyclobacteriaceae bacterium]|nr:oxidoreductase [Cyclobacteriaceae bacterium]HMV09726.1 oxidoreductase [Cyclobacteriaceae bacterium]HMV90458.1 oxidoreductase [Cyclobacteriaceae bacterium]HMX02279.1 oxidoreductase [Cyclobacteriaceae bacterium]HMX51180.1 oxidoreductase [Cyclobacteriaceae bacterium]
MKTALVAGSTGLIGNQLIDLLLSDNYYDVVKAISRTPLEKKHTKLENIVLDFDRMAEYAGQLNADDVFCCLGTTIKKVKTKEKFRQVDFVYPLELAKLSKANGAKQYLLVSALGADKKSSIFYNQVKGEVEEAIGDVGFTTYHIFRPSLLMGDRQENRSGEEAGKVFFKYLGFLVPKKYKGIDSIKVARAMQAFAKQATSGRHVHESAELQQY